MALPPGRKFCGGCGQPFASSAGSGAERAGRSPDSYTPRHLAEKILTSKAALEGERKQVTVLFADLKGSMELLADRDPEEARKLLDPVLERMMEAVHRYEGTVNQVMGDGIMALFGAPVAHEDHAVRACYAALDMQGAIRRYSEETRRSHGIETQIRVGLNSGEVVIRTIGSDLHMDYTAVGQTTHLAGRMEQLATPGTIRLTADTLRLAEGYIEVKPLGPVPVKGLETPIEVYEMVGAGPRRSRFHAAAARGLSTFVGRDAELEALRQALARAAAGHGQVVTIVGEPGVGKSRLVWEVTHSHRVHGWLVLQAGSVSHGKATAYLPVIDLLKDYFEIEDRDAPRVVREKLTGKLLTLDRALEGSLPPLLALLDVPPDNPEWPMLDPPQRRRRTLDAVKRLLLRESRVQPLLVVLEDLHWIDSETQALLDGLVESLPTTRLLLLVNYRTEYQNPWGSRTSYTQLRLEALPRENADQLLGALLGSDAGLEPLKHVLITRTEGNPFFVEESVRALVETGSLAGERGAYRLARPLPVIQVPATVQAVLAARIDRLAQADKTLLQTAAVVGKDVPVVLLRSIVDRPEDELRAAIGRLQAAEFLYEAGAFPNLEYTFKHALTHEVSYGSMLQDRRRPLHARIVDAIEGLYPDRLAEHVELLAHHALRGERWETALAYARQAGDRALGRSACREAVSAYDQALTALSHLPENRSTLETAVDIQLSLRTALIPLGDFPRIFEVLKDAEARASTLGDDHRLARVAILLCLSLYVTHRVDEALAAGQHGFNLAGQAGDAGLQGVASTYLGLTHMARTDYIEAARCCSDAAALLQGSHKAERFGQVFLPSVIARGFLASALAEIGRISEALDSAHDGLNVALQLGKPPDLLMAQFGIGMVELCRGQLGAAAAALERARAISRETGLPLYLRYILPPLGLAYALEGRATEGVSLLEEAARQDEALNFLAHHALTLCRLAEAYLMAGRQQDSQATAQRALVLARSHDEPGHVAHALRVLAAIGAAGEPLDLETTDRHYREALAIADARGMRPLVAHCHLGLGKVHSRTGARTKAEEHLASATALYREMDMAFYLTQAEAALAGGQ
jgi:class 3 adenylate cyclase/tetratricopeptide (TPR) repeat protein